MILDDLAVAITDKIVSETAAPAELLKSRVSQSDQHKKLKDLQTCQIIGILFESGSKGISEIDFLKKYSLLFGKELDCGTQNLKNYLLSVPEVIYNFSAEQSQKKHFYLKSLYRKKVKITPTKKNKSESAPSEKNKKNPDASKRKTAICRSWNAGKCQFQSKPHLCIFAHGIDELVKPAANLPQKPQRAEAEAQPMIVPGHFDLVSGLYIPAQPKASPQ